MLRLQVEGSFTLKSLMHLNCGSAGRSSHGPGRCLWRTLCTLPQPCSTIWAQAACRSHLWPPGAQWLHGAACWAMWGREASAWGREASAWQAAWGGEA